MPQSGAQIEQKLAQVFITLDGAPAPGELMDALKMVEVDANLFLPAMCAIEINHVEPWAKDQRLKIGAAIKVEGQTSDGQTKAKLFEGEVVAIEASFREQGHNYVIIRAYDRLHRLQHGTFARSFVNATDMDIARKIGGETGFQVSGDATTYVHPQIFQDNVTNFEFLLTRARAMNRIMTADGKKLEFRKPSTVLGSAPVVQLRVGETLAEFHPRVSVAGQRKQVQVRGWDPKTKRAVVGNAASSPFNTGTLNGFAGHMHAAFNRGFSADPGTYLVTDQPVASQAEGDALATSMLEEIWSTEFRGDGTCFGDPRIKAGAKVQVDHAGAFDGTYFVTQVRHIFSSGHYLTHFVVSGLFADTAADLVSTGAVLGHNSSGRVMNGVSIGIVTDIEDPESLGRVKVKFPWFSEEHASYWSRIAAPMAGPGRGFMLIPEVNDEVLVAFEQGDFNRPFVVGALWNGTDNPPHSTSDAITGGKVNKRILKTRKGHILRFDDTDGSEKIEIIDKTGRNLIMIESSANKITIQADGDIEITSKKDIKMKGMNLSFEGQTKAEMKAAMVDVTATGKATLKGATVEIN